MSHRLFLSHLGLFCAAYCGFLWYFWSTAPQENPPQLAIPAQFVRSAERVRSSEPDKHIDGEQPRAIVSSSLAQTKATEIETEQLGPVTELSETSGLTEETVAEVSALSTQAIGSADPRERAKAITQLRNLAMTPTSLQALTQVLESDPVAQNRLFAVSALASLLAQGDEQGVIGASLQRAMSDADPRVAARARDAYQSVNVPVE